MVICFRWSGYLFFCVENKCFVKFKFFILNLKVFLGNVNFDILKLEVFVLF